VFVTEGAEAQVHTSGEKPDEQIEIEEVRWPSGGLMFGDGSDDRDVDLRVSSIPERVETTGPRSNNARDGKENKSTEGYEEDEEDEAAEKSLELSARELLSNELDESNNLDEAKNT
jgi:hypothetical protein